MQNIIQINCPHCHNQSELKLESQAKMVVLSCSNCRQYLLYFHGKTYKVDSEEIQSLGAEKMQAVEGLMKTKNNLPFTSKKDDTKNSLHRVGEPVLDHAINEDDIIDLLIELAQSDDVNDFVNGMFKK